MVWLLLVLFLSSAYININLFRKIEQLEDANEEAATWLTTCELSLKHILTHIRELDSKNIFETDDDVGSTFSAIKDTIESLEELSNNEKK